MIRLSKIQDNCFQRLGILLGMEAFKNLVIEAREKKKLILQDKKITRKVKNKEGK